MIATSDYSLFSLATYPVGENETDLTDNLPGGWVHNLEDDFIEIEEIGFAGYVFRNPTTQKLVIAYRGSADPSDIFTDSDATADWIQNDFPLAAGIVGPQFFAAYHVYKQIAENPAYAGYDISLTGHSLGGALASFVADYLGVEATVFAPLPVGELLRKARDMDGLTAHILSAGLPTMTGADYFINLFGLSDLIDGTVIENALIAGYSNLPTGMTEIGPPEAEGGDITIVDIEDQISNWYLNPPSDYVGDGRDDYIAISQALVSNLSEASFFHRMDVFAFILATGIDFVEIQDAIPALNAMLMDDGSGWGSLLVDGVGSDSIWKTAVLQDLSEPTSTIDVFNNDMLIAATVGGGQFGIFAEHVRSALSGLTLIYTSELVKNESIARVSLLSDILNGVTLDLRPTGSVWTDLPGSNDLSNNFQGQLTTLLTVLGGGYYTLFEGFAEQVYESHSAWAVSFTTMQDGASIVGADNARNFMLAPGNFGELSGGNKDDILIATGNGSILYTSRGDDAFLSYGIATTIDYSEAEQGVVANLQTGIVTNDGFGDVDTLYGIELFIGSNFDDSVHASDPSGDNVVYSFDAGGGNDDLIFSDAYLPLEVFIDGGEGFDRIYFGNPAEAPVNNSVALADANFADVQDIEEINFRFLGTHSVALNTNAMSAFDDGLSIYAGALGTESSLHIDADGFAKNLAITGTLGNDSFVSGDGDDWIYGRGGNDTISSGDGDDTAIFKYWNDFKVANIDLGNGYDTIQIGTDRTPEGDATTTINPGIRDNDFINLQGMERIDIAASGIFNITLGNRAANATGGSILEIDAAAMDSASDKLNINGETFSKKLNITAGDGADTIEAGTDDDVILSGAGSDHITGGDGDDILFGGSDDDVIIGDSEHGTFEFQIYAGADNYQNQWPGMRVYVNGSLKEYTTVVDQRPTPVWGDVDLNLYEFSVSGITGPVTSVRIELVNDRGSYYHRINEISGYDINLHIGSVHINGADIGTWDFRSEATGVNWHPDVPVSVWHAYSYVEWTGREIYSDSGHGNDVLNGGAGNDLLYGGAGSDTFVFEGFWGDDTVQDFDPFQDMLNFRAIDGITTLAELQSALAISDTGSGLSLAIGDNSVYLDDMNDSDQSDVLAAISYNTAPATPESFLIA